MWCVKFEYIVTGLVSPGRAGGRGGKMEKSVIVIKSGKCKDDEQKDGAQTQTDECKDDEAEAGKI